MYEKSLEDRVAALDAEVEMLKRSVKTAVVLMAAKPSSPFKSPLEKFFEGEGGLFEFDPLKEFRCIESCVRDLDNAMQAAGNDEAAQDAAIKEHLECYRKCVRIS